MEVLGLMLRKMDKEKFENKNLLQLRIKWEKGISLPEIDEARNKVPADTHRAPLSPANHGP